MKFRIEWLLLGLLALFAGCASPQLDGLAPTQSDPAAHALVEASRQAHGGAAFDAIRDVSVRYDGKWAAIGPRTQPVLVDRDFRKSSEERLLIDPRVIAQEHRGPQGEKVVVRGRDGVEVSYDGKPNGDAEVKRAAALVADAYAMFLLGPFYFDRPGVTLALAGEAEVDGAVCDRVLAVLRPGFGFAEEDRVMLFIDRETRILRRVRMTLNGFESTTGAEVDVTFRDPVRIGGVLWPTDFDERIREPFDLPAHRWKLLGLDLNRGMTRADLTSEGFTGAAVAPAVALEGVTP